MESKDSFRELSFDGRPSQYRDFRRRVILAVASLEDKSQHLAGPRLMGRLSGEAWRAVEHLKISDLRVHNGWLTILSTLDKHYKHLPELELHESIDEFMFSLKRRGHESATAFASRFKTSLSRLELLIAQERQMRTGKKRKKGDESDSEVAVSEENLEEAGSSQQFADEETDNTDDQENVLDLETPATPHSRPQSTAPSQQSSGKGSSRGRSSTGTHAGDWKKQQLKMQRILGTLEEGHTKPKPVFPESVLGHLFMRKYGLSREQRAHLIRSTNGSSRFKDIEKLMRASDFDEQKGEDRRPVKHRRETYAVTAGDESSSVEDPSLTSEDDAWNVNEGDEPLNSSSAEELEEVYELQKKAKKDARKSIRTYKESKRRVKEIKKNRQPYLPVVALQQGGDQPSGSSTGQMPKAGKERYERKSFDKKGAKDKGKKHAPKQEAHLADVSFVTEFSYTVHVEELSVLLASIPVGCALLDTGCTTSVVGRKTAERYTRFFQARGYPVPETITLPPVVLRGFAGQSQRSTEGLRWGVQLGNLFGNISTYVVEGDTPFLLSRQVLESMEAIIDTGKGTITSRKHKMFKVPLRRASNGHFLLPLHPEISELEVQHVSPATDYIDDVKDEVEKYEPNEEIPQSTSVPATGLEEQSVSEENTLQEPPCKSEPCAAESSGPHVRRKTSKTNTTPIDVRRAFQHIAKNTTTGIVDLRSFKDDLDLIFEGVSPKRPITHAFVAYRPRLERIPEEAGTHSLECSIASLSKDGKFDRSEWQVRPPNCVRSQVKPMHVAIFAYRIPTSDANQEEDVSEVNQLQEECSPIDFERFEEVEVPLKENCDHGHSLEALYEDADWLNLESEIMQARSVQKLERNLRSFRKMAQRMTLSRLLSDRERVRAELSEWLGDQAFKLDQKVGLIEVYTGQARLSGCFEKESQTEAIRIGYSYGHDLDKPREARLLLLLIAYTRPRHVWISFPCKYWGPWARLNMSKSELLKAEIESHRIRARRQLHLVSECWLLQMTLQGHCHLENPLASEAWNELVLGEAWTTRIDQCSLGLRSPKSNLPVLKPTRIVSSLETLMQAMSNCRCDKQHKHDHLEGAFKGKNLTSWAENYPSKFSRHVAKALAEDLLCAKHVPLDLHEVLAEEEAEELQPESDPPEPMQQSEHNKALNPKNVRNEILVKKLHVNTGHASVEQMLRLAHRCQASKELVAAIKAFSCPICEEMKPPSSHRPSAIPHAEHPNQIVGIDFVQIELKRENDRGKVIEQKYNVLTCVDLATSFAQMIVVEPGSNQMSRAFHEAWSRPYGPPHMIFTDPTNMSLSKDFQQYLSDYDIVLIHCATESHYQLGQVEIANRVLRGMIQKVWITSTRPPKECIEICCSVRNDQLRKSGYSPSQWFLGRSPRTAGMLQDVDEQTSFVNQTKFLTDKSFHDKVLLREEAAKAFQAEHAKDTWRRAVAMRARPMRGPYVVGQQVYMFRARGRGQLSTRHGRWLGPGIVIGTESSTGGIIPRIVWVSYNGFLYRCSPEGLRPLATDEQAFRQLARELAEGAEPADIRGARHALSEQPSRYRDLMSDLPRDSDHELDEDLDDEDIDGFDDDEDDNNPGRGSKNRRSESGPSSEGVPRKIRRRFYRSSEYWQRRAQGEPPLGALQEGTIPQVQANLQEPSSSTGSPPKRARFASQSQLSRILEYEPPAEDYSPSIAVAPENRENESQPINVDNPNEEQNLLPPQDPNPDQNQGSSEHSVQAPGEDPTAVAESADVPMPDGVDVPVPEPEMDELLLEERLMRQETVLEVSIDVVPEDITKNPLCLWTVLEECFPVVPKAKQRRVEVSFRKLSPAEKELFKKAMLKEWNSWIENKVTALCKAKGIPQERIIKARWVLVWKKSSDPDVKEKTPKARLVLVGWQDPELGQIATDSPTLRKETKHLVLSICAAQAWQLWGADIKTAFLSGDPSTREIYFRPPPEVKQWMSLEEDDILRLQKAAYGLAEAPRAWFLRLCRELRQTGLTQSQLDPCLWFLRRDGVLQGICGIHVDDLIGGGTKEMTKALEELKTRLPFGDFRNSTIRYTGIEIRQDPNTKCIEIGQESYIEALQPISTKTLGTASTPVTDPSILRTCAGQLAWVSNATRPDMSFLASYLQGIQDKGTVAHIQMYNKAVREMKENKICLRFPSKIPIEQWRILCFADAGWNTRANGESQGGYILCLSSPDIFKYKQSRTWIVDWASKKLRRVVRSSVAAETLSGQNGLDGIEMMQAQIAELVYGVSPRDFRESTPEHPAALVVDSKGFYDAVNKSCSSTTISVEKRLQIDYAIAKETMRMQNILVFWTSNIHMVADCLTKLKADNKPLYDLICSGSYKIHLGLESGKKEKAKARQKAITNSENA